MKNIALPFALAALTACAPMRQATYVGDPDKIVMPPERAVAHCTNEGLKAGATLRRGGVVARAMLENEVTANCMVSVGYRLQQQ